LEGFTPILVQPDVGAEPGLQGHVYIEAWLV